MNKDELDYCNMLRVKKTMKPFLLQTDTESVDGDVNGDFKILKDLSLKWNLQERYKNNTKNSHEVLTKVSIVSH